MAAAPWCARRRRFAAQEGRRSAEGTVASAGALLADAGARGRGSGASRPRAWPSGRGLEAAESRPPAYRPQAWRPRLARARPARAAEVIDATWVAPPCGAAVHPPHRRAPHRDPRLTAAAAIRRQLIRGKGRGLSLPGHADGPSTSSTRPTRSSTNRRNAVDRDAVAVAPGDFDLAASSAAQLAVVAGLIAHSSSSSACRLTRSWVAPRSSVDDVPRARCGRRGVGYRGPAGPRAGDVGITVRGEGL